MSPELHQQLINWRRHLHAYPELSLHERATAAFVQERLADFGIHSKARSYSPAH
jgi:metal-dependent amidase/aminoacylase/carboxypeptidase family protein